MNNKNKKDSDDGVPFPNDESMPFVLKTLVDLQNVIKDYERRIASFHEEDDVAVFCHLLSTLFINEVRGRLELLADEKKWNLCEKVHAYDQIVTYFMKIISHEDVLSLFESPPEKWAHSCMAEC